MESFKFNNVSSDSLSLIVKSMPLVPRAQKNIESIEIPGRNGKLYIDNENYLSINYTINCISLDKNKIDDIKSTFQGKGKLTLSKYNDRFWNATIKNQIDFSKYLNYLNEFPLQLELDPIAYSITETVETISTDGINNVGGNSIVYPLIKVSGVGSFSVNGYEITVSESNISIDCDLMNCFNGLISKNDKVILSEFPKLTPGNNPISLGDGVTSIEIRYRKGWV